ncbi:MAG: helix-turn-helix domain-containing protein [bacterium]
MAKRSRSPARRCPLDEAMALLGGAWTAHVIYYLQDHPRRFGALKRDLGTISAKVLASRLKALESKGVVSRTVKPTSPPTVEYALTPLGARLKPIIASIARVGVELARRSAG